MVIKLLSGNGNYFASLTAKITEEQKLYTLKKSYMSKYCFFILIVICLSQTFCYTSTEVVFPSIKETAVIDKDELTIILNKGGTLHLLDGGEKNEQLKFETELRKIYFLNESEGWALDKNGQIWATVDNAKSWLKRGNIGYDVNNSQSDFVFVNNQIGWLMAGLSILHTEDGGNSWISVYPNNEFSYTTLKSTPTKIFPVNLNTTFLGMSNGKVLRTTNRGKSWDYIGVSMSGDFDVRSLFALSEKECWVGGRGNLGGLYYTDDGGDHWQQLLDDKIKSKIGISSISFATPKIGWIVGVEFLTNIELPNKLNGVVLKTTDGGKTWFQLEDEFYKLPFSEIKFVDSQNGWLIGEKSVYRTATSGNYWQEIYRINK